MARRYFPCDSGCPMVTRSHRTLSARRACQDRNAAERSRPEALAPKPPALIPLTPVTGVSFRGRDIQVDLSDASLWCADFAHATFRLDAAAIEGAFLPGVDLRGFDGGEAWPGVPMIALTEARGAIVDDELVAGLESAMPWMFAQPEDTLDTPDTRLVEMYTVPFLQWSIVASAWEQLRAEGHTPNTIVEAAQTIPGRNVDALRAHLRGASAADAIEAHPHDQAWGPRPLTLPPQSNASRRHAQVLRSY